MNNQLIILSHYPIMYWKNQWHGTIHLYGHIHVTRDYDHLLDYIQNEYKIGNPCKMYNVGCMMPRQKLINTYHCNKHEQRILDDYIKNNRINHSYYHLYNSDKTNFALMIGIGFNSACVALNKLGITIKNADNTYKSIGEVIQEASIKWKELT